MNNNTEPKHKGHLARYRQITMVLGKYRLGKVLRYVEMQNYQLVGWMFRGNPWRKMTYSEWGEIQLQVDASGIKLGTGADWPISDKDVRQTKCDFTFY